MRTQNAGWNIQQFVPYAADCDGVSAVGVCLNVWVGFLNVEFVEYGPTFIRNKM